MKIKNKELMPSSVYINGQWKKAESGKKIAVYNKANGEIIGEVPDCGEEECVLAIDGAKKAQIEWAKLTPKDRGLTLGRWHDLILENLDDLITILSLEQERLKMKLVVKY